MKLKRKKMKIIAPAQIIFLFTVIAGFILQYVAPVHFFASGIFILVLSTIVLIAGILIAVWALKTMKTEKVSPNHYTPTAKLIVAGPYQYSRNPMYISMILVYLGITLLLNSLWFFVLLMPMSILVCRGIIQPEEMFLEAYFGEEYKNYKKRVRRWF
ncbi:MAG: protein-S-isoprenylcysteine O-methyltransferase Ste14 [Psychromonas sp.]|jgi:protein-S-isoprenylcysteine O-methyltransferase Ste14